MSEPRLSSIITGLFWLIAGTILLGIVFRVIPSDLTSWGGLACAALVAIGKGMAGAALDAARKKGGGDET
jgi:hypothetical protein